MKKAWLGQWVSGLVVAVGIGLEIGMGADIGYIAITTGALMWGLFTKLKRY